MAFLRSIARYNSLLSRKFSVNEFNSKFSRDELLARQRYYAELRRELSTKSVIGASNLSENQKRGNNGTNAMSTAAAAAAAVSASKAGTGQSASRQPAHDPSQRDPLDTSFNDPIAAFKSKTTWELIRAYFVYLMCSSEYLVENNMKVKGPIHSIRSIFAGIERPAAGADATLLAIILYQNQFSTSNRRVAMPTARLM